MKQRPGFDGKVAELMSTGFFEGPVGTIDPEVVDMFESLDSLSGGLFVSMLATIALSGYSIVSAADKS
jgi:hypothetical protein